jgi:hypothetical protein
VARLLERAKTGDLDESSGTARSSTVGTSGGVMIMFDFVTLMTIS